MILPAYCKKYSIRVGPVTGKVAHSVLSTSHLPRFRALVWRRVAMRWVMGFFPRRISKPHTYRELPEMGWSQHDRQRSEIRIILWRGWQSSSWGSVRFWQPDMDIASDFCEYQWQCRHSLLSLGLEPFIGVLIQYAE